MFFKIHFIFLLLLLAHSYAFNITLRNMAKETDVICREDGSCHSYCGYFRCFDRLVTPCLDGSEPSEAVVFFKLRFHMGWKNLLIFSIIDSFVPPKILTYDDDPLFPINRISETIHVPESLHFLKPGNPYCVFKGDTNMFDPRSETNRYHDGSDTGNLLRRFINDNCGWTIGYDARSLRLKEVDMAETSVFGPYCTVCDVS